MVRKEMSITALIPARSGSQRILNKNIKHLNGRPLIAYTIQAAIEAKIFNRIITSTDDTKIADIAIYFGSEAPVLRPKKYNDGLHYPWIKHLLLRESFNEDDCFMILFPTNPFRDHYMIRRTWDIFRKDKHADSLITVGKAQESPSKMWRFEPKENNYLIPFYGAEQLGAGEQCYNRSHHELDELYIQKANIRITSINTILTYQNETGINILPFIVEGYKGFDINCEADWMLAETLIEKGLAILPEV